MILPMRISASLASVFCCATAEADASSPTARNDTENRLLIGIFLDCQSDQLLPKVTHSQPPFTGKFRCDAPCNTLLRERPQTLVSRQQKAGLREKNNEGLSHFTPCRSGWHRGDGSAWPQQYPRPRGGAAVEEICRHQARGDARQGA